MTLPYGSCVAKSAHPVVVELYVAPLTLTSLQQNSAQVGSFDDPFNDLFDALSKGHELAATGTNSTINIYLLKGTHVVRVGGSSYKATKSSQNALDFSVTIQ